MPMYVLPPVEEDPKQQLTLLNEKDWNKDDWVMTEANNSFQAHVTDKRWECPETFRSKVLDPLGDLGWWYLDETSPTPELHSDISSALQIHWVTVPLTLPSH
ncbi:hypothetical protein GEV33_006172 [Tenebrio molitor]|uniref:Uncharacterized protein n=1 Tax=Tenebrio molitor TaxID=7067 RepID=A0A8J6HL23_TENMO|nr:hypothetical protein GEV33_006172 [Tenebrio molitor]